MNGISPKKENLIAVGLLILVTILTYSPLINSFGYYLDDWYVVWAGRTQGPQLIADFHQYDRPLMGIFYAIHYSILGDNPLGWQIYILILRFLSIFAFWGTLRLIWPNALIPTTSAVLLFAVYPGFLQLPNAGVKTNPLFTLMSATISIYFSIKAVLSKKAWKKILFQVFSVLFSFTYLFYIEYMIGLEFIRWSFFWIVLRKENPDQSIKTRIKQWILYSIPTMFVLVSMICWRLFFFDSGRKSMSVGDVTTGLINSPIRSLISLFVEIFRDFIETVFMAWFVPAYQLAVGERYRVWVISMAFALLVVLLYLLYIRLIRNLPGDVLESKETLKPTSWVLIGGLGVLAALGPVILVGRQVYLDLVFNGFNKYSIHASIGVSIFIVGLLLIFARQSGLIVVVALLLGLSVHMHYLNGVRHQSAWQYQQDLWWQFSWRVPDLEDGTLVTAVHSELPFVESHEIWGPLNIIYRPDSEEITLSGQILNKQTLGWFQRQMAESDGSVRGVVPIVRDYGNALVVTVPDNLSCLHVVDGHRLEDYKEPYVVQLMYENSNSDKIITFSDVSHKPPVEIFGPEPEYTWCYYYQKMTLARQVDDWETVADLADEANDLGFKPLNRSEWIPVLEAYVNLERYKDAKNIFKIIRGDQDLQYLLCKQLRNELQNSGENTGYIYSNLCEKNN
jgi:hypothetical protein